MSLILYQILLYFVTVFIITMIVIWDLKLKYMLKKLKFEQEINNNIKIILDEYLKR